MNYALLNLLAQIGSSAAAGRAQGKETEANLAQNQNNNATSRYQAIVNANRLQNIDQPSANMSQAGQGALMSTWKPMSVTPASVPYGSNTNGAVKPTITGGPSITPEMRQTGEAAMKAALQRQLAGNPISSTFPSDESLGLNALPKQSLLDSILGYGSMGAGLLAEAGKAGAFGGSTASTATAAPAASMGSPGMGSATQGVAPSGSGAFMPIGGGSPGQRQPGNLLDYLREMQNQTGGYGMYAGWNPFNTGGGGYAVQNPGASDPTWVRRGQSN